MAYKSKKPSMSPSPVETGTELDTHGAVYGRIHKFTTSRYSVDYVIPLPEQKREAVAGPVGKATQHDTELELSPEVTQAPYLVAQEQEQKNLSVADQARAALERVYAGDHDEDEVVPEEKSATVYKLPENPNLDAIRKAVDEAA
jgi:hypothetical protein